MVYHQDGLGEEDVFNSSPYFCGKKIISDTPVLITFDDYSTSYKIRFTKDSQGAWKSSTFTFDYTTSM